MKWTQRNIRNDKKEPGIQGNAVQQPVKYDESQFGFDIWFVKTKENTLKSRKQLI